MNSETRKHMHRIVHASEETGFLIELDDPGHLTREIMLRLTGLTVLAVVLGLFAAAITPRLNPAAAVLAVALYLFVVNADLLYHRTIWLRPGGDAVRITRVNRVTGGVGEQVLLPRSEITGAVVKPSLAFWDYLNPRRHRVFAVTQQRSVLLAEFAQADEAARIASVIHGISRPVAAT